MPSWTRGEWFNRKRPHGTLDYLPPVEYERSHHDQQQQSCQST